MRLPGTALLGDQSAQSALLKGRLRLIKRGTGKTKLLSCPDYGLVVGIDAPQHLVLDLKQICRIEEIAVLEKSRGDSLGMGIERSVGPQGLLLAVVGTAFGHGRLQRYQ